jgi:phosphate transport system substrate-binding protein
MRKTSRRTGAGVAITLIATLVLLVAAVPALAATNITGAGATFPLPLYQKWASDYNKKVSDVQVSYSGGGSSFGISQIKAGSVDFGGSDAPLNKGALNTGGLIQFPTCVGGVVPIYNLSGVASGKLRLTGPVLAKIYLGTIVKWNATPIKKLNPGVNLPDKYIQVVHRSDGSGTTWIFTNYLGLVSQEWRGDVGIGKTVSWPVGYGGNGNPGVANVVKTTEGAIGYVEYAYAKLNKLSYAQMMNASKKWVMPTANSFAAAAAATKWTWKNGFYEVLVNKPGTTTWPITGATFVLIKKSQKSVEFGRTMLKFFNWAYTDSSARSATSALDYVPMPTSVANSVKAVWSSSVKSGGKPCWP